MSIELPGLLIFVLCIAAGLFTPLGPIGAIGIGLPFEATALIKIGGMGLNVTDAYVMILMGATLALALSRRGSGTICVKNLILPVIICLHGAVAALLLPYIFEGKTLVALVSGAEGIQRVGRGFGLTVSPLAPTGSNISQLFYMCLQFMTFMFLLNQSRRYGSHVLVKILTIAIFVNFGMLAIQLLGLSEIQKWFFTADFRNLQEAKVAGVTRLVGGFREAARQGQFSAVGFSYWFALYIQQGRPRQFVIASACFAAAVLSLSSTAIACLAVALLLAGATVFWRSFISGRTNGLQRIAGFAGLGVLALILMWIAIGAGGRDLVMRSLTTIVLEKDQSASGLERAALFWLGLQVASDTYYLGAGLGATRANGLVSLWLSNLGLIGLLLMAVFIYRIYSPGPNSRVPRDTPVAPARIAFSVVLVACLISLTFPYLGQIFPVMAALAMRAGEAWSPGTTPGRAAFPRTGEVKHASPAASLKARPRASAAGTARAHGIGPSTVDEAGR